MRIFLNSINFNIHVHIADNYVHIFKIELLFSSTDTQKGHQCNHGLHPEYTNDTKWNYYFEYKIE